MPSPLRFCHLTIQVLLLSNHSPPTPGLLWPVTPSAMGCCRDGEKSIPDCVSLTSYFMPLLTVLEWLRQSNGYAENQGEGCWGFFLLAVERRSRRVFRQGIGSVENELTPSSIPRCFAACLVEQKESHRKIVSREFRQSPAIDEFEANQRPLEQRGREIPFYSFFLDWTLRVILFQGWEWNNHCPDLVLETFLSS